ncbi:MAG: hypothetical protein R8P61_09860 [Bacteroidia bacterium]|nr:hypothetical protein [Bacteroidia bacterium]
MQPQELLKQVKELHRIMGEAKVIVEGMQAKLPELEEPAMSAQCSVIRHFLHQTERQEELLKDMLTAKMAS